MDEYLVKIIKGEAVGQYGEDIAASLRSPKQLKMKGVSIFEPQSQVWKIFVLIDLKAIPTPFDSH